MTLDTLFGTTRHVGAAQECARAAVIFAYGVALVRIAGRRVFGKWAALDIIVSVVIGSSLSRALTGTAPFMPTIAGTAMLMAIHWLVARAAARSPALARLVEGSAITLAIDGLVDTHTRHRHAVTEADLDEAMRQRGVERVEQTDKIVLEPSGRITVLK